MRKFVAIIPFLICLIFTSCKKEEVKIYLDKKELSKVKPKIIAPKPQVQKPDEPLCNEVDEFSLKLPRIKKAYKRQWKEQWSYDILKSFESGLLNDLITKDDLILEDDLNEINCAGFKFAVKEERKLFWISMLAAIAYEESGYDPEEDYHEKNGTISAGLLQIDQFAANDHCSRYTGKAYDSLHMYRPNLNLECGLYIMKHQLNGGIRGGIQKIKKHIFTKQFYYWSVLKTSKKEKVKKHFIDNASTFGFCKRDKPLSLNSRNCVANKQSMLNKIKRVPAQR